MLFQSLIAIRIDTGHTTPTLTLQCCLLYLPARCHSHLLWLLLICWQEVNSLKDNSYAPHTLNKKGCNREGWSQSGTEFTFCQRNLWSILSKAQFYIWECPYWDKWQHQLLIEMPTMTYVYSNIWLLCVRNKGRRSSMLSSHFRTITVFSLWLSREFEANFWKVAKKKMKWNGS